MPLSAMALLMASKRCTSETTGPCIPKDCALGAEPPPTHGPQAAEKLCTRWAGCQVGGVAAPTWLDACTRTAKEWTLGAGCGCGCRACGGLTITGPAGGAARTGFCGLDVWTPRACAPGGGELVAANECLRGSGSGGAAARARPCGALAWIPKDAALGTKPMAGVGGVALTWGPVPGGACLIGMDSTCTCTGVGAPDAALRCNC